MNRIARTCHAWLALAAAAPLAAQDNAGGEERLARVIAVVGDSAVTDLDLSERLLAWQAESGRTPPSAGPELERLRRELLDQSIDELLLLQAAARDTTLEILESEVSSTVENHINRLRQQMGGQAALDKALAEQGQTPATYREALRAQTRRDLTITRYLARLRQERQPPPVTAADVNEYWESVQGQAGVRPAMITFEQVVIPVAASDSALETARVLADSIYQRILAEEDFGTLARRYSEDPGTRELGGDLGWFRQGQMYRQFDQVAFSPYVGAGDVTPPVRTPFGYHIIKVERVRGPERQARHILIRPDMSDADSDRSRAQAEEIAGRIRAGESVSELAQEFGDPDEERRVGPWPQDSLLGPYRAPLANVAEGDIVGPIELEGAGDLRKWAVVKVEAVEPSRPATLDDYREQIRENLAQQKLLQEIVQDIRRRTLVEIRLAGPSPDG